MKPSNAWYACNPVPRLEVLLTMIQAAVRTLFKRTFDVEADEDFMMHKTALPALVADYRDGDGAGPDPDELHFDMRDGPKTTWNAQVINILLLKLLSSEGKERGLAEISDQYWRELIELKYKRVRGEWKKKLPKRTDLDVEETSKDVEEQLLDKKEKTLKDARTTRRRDAVSTNADLAVKKLTIP